MSDAWPYDSRAGGEQARNTILYAAVSLATVDGLDSLTIGNLAAALGMSKSGLTAHFGSSTPKSCSRRWPRRPASAS